MDYGGGDHQNGKLGLRMAVWPQAKVLERGPELRPKLYDSSAKTAAMWVYLFI